MTSPEIDESAESFVGEMQASLDPAQYSEYNMGPQPDPVGALRRFAQEILDEVEERMKR